uniref:Uncharacterized protein n=1 Tax=Helianthus annuus TaxID=4232 RepID=A0A251RN79_HELAN
MVFLLGPGSIQLMKNSSLFISVRRFLIHLFLLKQLLRLISINVNLGTSQVLI